MHVQATHQMTRLASVLAISMSLLLSSCAGSSTAAESAKAATSVKPLPKPLIDLPLGKPGEMRTAVVAGGCFWCEEAAFEQLKGVTEVVSGYAGGTKETATYESYHASDHAEAIKITYDASQLTYGELLRVLFTAGDPTTKDGQKPDFGRGYRMAAFFAGDDQKRVAEAYIRQLDEAKSYDKPIAATVEPMPLGFFPAEDYHQHYVTAHPDQAYVRAWSLPKIAVVRAAFPDLVKPADQAPPNR